ncbi:class A beta-lactamase [Streptomyces sp. NPDC059853]|uniref:class A beta-lactamase n=1 Tax=Streptomyces sp. NPDC059853 TaxID=3346973 RepID=UPI003664F344
MWPAESARQVKAALLGALVLVPLVGCGAEGTGAGAADAARPAAAVADTAADPAEEFALLEEAYDARLGVYALDTGSGAEIGYREDERFAYASTFKALLCGAVLEEYGLEGMAEVIPYGEEDLLPNSPITEERVAEGGMSKSDLCDATVRYSDNAAANLLWDTIGGPAGLQERLAGLGDEVTRMERWETDLNEAAPGDERDTTTPEAFAGDLAAYTLGEVLPEPERAQLTEWLVTNTTGDELIRAGVGEGWTVGDKTGGGGHGTRNDIAVLWPDSGEPPVVLAVFSTREEPDADWDNALIAEAASVAVGALERD